MEDDDKQYVNKKDEKPKDSTTWRSPWECGDSDIFAFGLLMSLL